MAAIGDVEWAHDIAIPSLTPPTSQATDPKLSRPSRWAANWWRIVLIAPCFVPPMYSRWLALQQQRGLEVGAATIGKAVLFGVLQDTAIGLQTFVLVLAILPIQRMAIKARSHCRNSVRVATLVLLVGAFLYLTLATAVDITLLVQGLPRLNRSFLDMFIKHAGHFVSSIKAVLSFGFAAGFLAYIAVMAVWIYTLLQHYVGELPCIRVKDCSLSPYHDKTDMTRTSPAVCAMACFLKLFTASRSFRAVCLGVMVSVMALSLTLTLEDNPTVILLMSNALFALQTEPWLLHVSSSWPSMLTASIPHGAGLHHGQGSQSPQASSFGHNPILARLMGTSERVSWSASNASNTTTEPYPFWRTTLGFSGPQRFAMREIDPTARPNVLLINLESFRSREVGVLGGHAIKTRSGGQTVTPQLDTLSKTGVLFRQHYTSSVQTSRSLLSSLFGVIASLTYDSTIQSYNKRPLRLRGLAQILQEVAQYETGFWSAVDLSWDDWNQFLATHGFEHLYDQASIPTYRGRAMQDQDGTTWGLHDQLSFEALAEFLTQRTVHQQQQASVNHPSRRPLFMTVFTVSSHDPFHVPSDFHPTTNYSAFLTPKNKEYVDVLHYADHQLGQFIKTMRARGLMNNTIVLIQGDHGYGREEHAGSSNLLTSRVYEEGMHVPMLLLADDFLPPASQGIAVDALTTQYDLLATVLDMLQLTNVSNHGMGQSMLRESASDRAVLMGNPYLGVPTGMRVGDLKIIRDAHAKKYEVFNLTRDPSEHHADAISRSKANGTLREDMTFMRDAMRMVQSLFATDGFMPEAA